MRVKQVIGGRGRMSSSKPMISKKTHCAVYMSVKLRQFPHVGGVIPYDLASHCSRS